MRKLLSLAVAIGVLISTFWATTADAQAAGLITYRGGLYVWGKGLVFVFDASGYRNKDVRDATIFVGSNFHDLGCTVNKEEGKIVCVLRGGLTQHAGEIGVIYLGGQIFYVIIPDRNLPEETVGDTITEEPLTCEDPLVLGAMVEFDFGDESSFVEFVPGDTLEEVEDLANSWVDGEFVIGYELISDMECGFPPQ